MHLLVHIGAPKTGSTSLQNYLASLKAPQISFIYPDGESTPHLISEAFNTNLKINPLYKQRGLSDEEIDALQQHQRGRYLQEITSAKTPLVIVSSENISQFTPTALDAFHTVNLQYFSHITYVGYFRHPYAAYASVLQQNAKLQGTKMLEKKFNPPYHKTIQHLRKIAGETHVHAHLFERESLHNGCIVADFCAKYSIPYFPQKAQNQNESLSLEAIQLLFNLWDHYPLTEKWYWYEQFIPSRHKKAHIAYKQRILTRIVNTLMHHKGTKLALHPELTDSIMGEHGHAYKAWLETEFPQSQRNYASPDQIRSLDVLRALTEPAFSALTELSGKPVPPKASSKEIAQLTLAL